MPDAELRELAALDAQAGDLDDYKALQARRWGASDFEKGDQVVVLRSGVAATAPLDTNWFVRRGKVLAVQPDGGRGSGAGQGNVRSGDEGEDSRVAWSRGAGYGDRLVLSLLEHPDLTHRTRKFWRRVRELHVAYSAPGSSSKTVQVVPAARTIYGTRGAPDGRVKTQEHANVTKLLVDGPKGIAAQLANATQQLRVKAGKVRGRKRPLVRGYATASLEVARLKAMREDPPLYRRLFVVPLRDLPFRYAKYDVVLREEPLWATHAMHTILSRMVLFRCRDCNQRFPTFHPAFRPPSELEMLLLEKKQFGAPVCSVEVARWDTAPPLVESDEDLLVASEYEGRCRVCDLDIKKFMKARGLSTEEGVIALRSAANRMDPCWNFPHEELAELFMHATVTEALLVALEHMQMDYVTVGRTGLSKFRRNVISFP